MAKLDTPTPVPHDETPVAANQRSGSTGRIPDLDAIAGEPEALYSAEYLRECADDEARQERLAELRRRIEAGAYRIDADRIAEEMLVRGDFS